MRVHSLLFLGIYLLSVGAIRCLGRPTTYNSDELDYPAVLGFEDKFVSPSDGKTILTISYETVNAHKVITTDTYDECLFSVQYIPYDTPRTVNQPFKLYIDGVLSGSGSRAVNVLVQGHLGTLVPSACPEPSTYASVFGGILLGFGSYRKWIKGR